MTPCIDKDARLLLFSQLLNVFTGFELKAQSHFELNTNLFIYNIYLTYNAMFVLKNFDKHKSKLEDIAISTAKYCFELC